MVKNVFVYGTLLNSEVFQIFVKGKFRQSVATISGFKRVRVDGERYPAIYPDDHSIVEGKIIFDLNVNALQALDHYEGDYYQRQTVHALLPDRSKQTCEAYVIKPEYYFLLTKEPWSNEYFREHHLANFVQGWIDDE